MKKWTAVILTLALALSLFGCGNAAKKPALSDTGAFASVSWDTPMSKVPKLLPGGELSESEKAVSYTVKMGAFEGLSESNATFAVVISDDKETVSRIQLIAGGDSGERTDLYEALVRLYTQRFGEPMTSVSTLRVWQTKDTIIRLDYTSPGSSSVQILLGHAEQEEAK